MVLCELASNSRPMIKSTRERKLWDYGMLHHHEPELKLSPGAPDSSSSLFDIRPVGGIAVGTPRGKKIQPPDIVVQSGEPQTFCRGAMLRSSRDCASGDARVQ